MRGTWSLDDAEKRAEKNPATFVIPPVEVRETLKVGWIAKLIFMQDNRGERMWVRVLDVSEGPQYRGVLESEPVILEGIRRGASVAFAASHVADYIDTKRGSSC